MNPPFSIIEGGLATAPTRRKTTSLDKVIRFQKPADEEASSAIHRSGLRVLDDTENFRLIPAHETGHVLDFEYNGVPARHGFLLE